MGIISSIAAYRWACQKAHVEPEPFYLDPDEWYQLNCELQTNKGMLAIGPLNREDDTIMVMGISFIRRA